MRGGVTSVFSRRQRLFLTRLLYSEAEKIGFAFDIDGVLAHGKCALPEALRTMEMLHKDSSPIVPVSFVTNSGGLTEQQKADELSSMLKVRVDSHQVILSHTPFKDIVMKVKSEGPALVVGRGDTLHVARSYGLNEVTSARALATRDTSSVPFWKERDSEIMDQDHGYGTKEKPLKSILIFTDPNDWYLELQIVLDVLQCGGVFGGSLDISSERSIPSIYVSHQDTLWKNEFANPRLGLGAFFACLEGLYNKITGRQLQYKVFGKPNMEPFTLTENSLKQQALKIWQNEYLSKIFMIGDNPAVDIRGANTMGDPWVSVLVQTGVYRKDQVDSRLSKECDTPDMVFNHVEDAVLSIIHQRRNQRWHSMR